MRETTVKRPDACPKCGGRFDEKPAYIRAGSWAATDTHFRGDCLRWTCVDCGYFKDVEPLDRKP